MNPIGIEHNLDRPRIKKLLTIGLVASIVTAAGDFLLGYATEVQVGGSVFDAVLASAPNLTDGTLVAGGLLGMVGIFLEGLSFFAVWRLMADADPRGAHLFRAGIFCYLWLAPVGCHLNVALMNLAYKHLWLADPAGAHRLATTMLAGFGLPVYVLLTLAWVPMVVVQWRAFARGATPYPAWAKWFCLPVGVAVALASAIAVGPATALGSALLMMSLSTGNTLTFGGLLATLPSKRDFEAYRHQLDSR